MPHTAQKPSPKPSKAPPPTTKSDGKPKRHQQFKKTEVRTMLFSMLLPMGTTGLIFGAMMLYTLAWPQSFIGRSYIGYLTELIMNWNPFAITIIFNFAFVAVMASFVYLKELAENIAEEEEREKAEAEAKEGKAESNTTIPEKPEPKKKK